MSPLWGFRIYHCVCYKHVAPLGLNEPMNSCLPRLIRNTDISQPLHNLHRLQTNRNHLPNQPDNILLIIRTVRVIDDATPFICLDAILIYHPLQRRPIPKSIIKRLRRYPVKRQEIVVHNLRLILGQLHLLHTPIERCIRCLDETQRIFLHIFIADVNLPQPSPRFGKLPKVRRVWQVRQVPLEVRLIPLPICRVVEQTVDIMKDVPLADGLVPVMRPELCQRPIGDVLPAVPPILVVGVERETLGFFKLMSKAGIYLPSRQPKVFLHQYQQHKSLDFLFRSQA